MDYRKSHYIKALLDEIFGENRFLNEVIWKRADSHNDPHRYGVIDDRLLVYRKSDAVLFNMIYKDYSEKYLDAFYTQNEPDTKRRYRLDHFTKPKGSIGYFYEYKGCQPPPNGWRCPIETMIEWDKKGVLVLRGKRVYKKRYLDEQEGALVNSIWDDISGQLGNEQVGYPTQKPESLISRVVEASTESGDIVIDAFAGSGTTLAVAEKLGRRWIGSDCGKLAIYAIQKRMLNLRKEIGNKGPKLEAKPFTLYNAGLYDFSTLKELPWQDWRFFALQLFGCRDEPHKIGGIQFDGYRQGHSVMVFNHMDTKHQGACISEETIQEIHEAAGSRVGSKVFIIAPALAFDFQQDYVDLDKVRYYALRIPYSIIHELHRREFTALKQPSDEMAINDTVEAVGFDFIRTPELKYKTGTEKPKGQLSETGFIKIETFKSDAVVREPFRKKGNLETLSMVMLDFDYDEANKVFDFDAVYYADALEKQGWKVSFQTDQLGRKMMAVFLDIYGNEARVLIDTAEFGKTEPKEKTVEKE